MINSILNILNNHSTVAKQLPYEFKEDAGVRFLESITVTFSEQDHFTRDMSQIEESKFGTMFSYFEQNFERKMII